MIDTLIVLMFICVICNTNNWSPVIKIIIFKKYFMKKDFSDHQYCINVVVENAKKRINLLDKTDQKCILEEYKEWFNDDFDYQSVLLLREDPII